MSCLPSKKKMLEVTESGMKGTQKREVSHNPINRSFKKNIIPISGASERLFSKACSHFTIWALQMTVLFHNATFHHKSVSISKQGGGRLCNWLLLRPEWHTASHTYTSQLVWRHRTCIETCERATPQNTSWRIKCTSCSKRFCLRVSCCVGFRSRGPSVCKSACDNRVENIVTDRDQRFLKVLMWTRDFSRSRSQVVRSYRVHLRSSPSAGCNQLREMVKIWFKCVWDVFALARFQCVLFSTPLFSDSLLHLWLFNPFLFVCLSFL